MASAQPDATSVISATEAAAMAIDNSPDLRAEYAVLELRDGAWRLGLRNYLPSLGFTGGSDERLAAFGSDSFTKTLSASVEQPIWDGGRLSTARSLESAEIALSRAELDRKTRELGETAVAAYRTVIASRRRLAIKKTSFVSATGERRLLATEIGLGLAKAFDLVEADMQLAGMELEVETAELELSQAESDLAEALGVETLPELSERLLVDRPAARFDADAFAVAVVELSPELEKARYGLTKKRAEVKAASQAWLPTIGLKASASVSGTSFPLTRSTWSAGLTIDFSSPFLSGGTGATAGGEPPYDSTARTSLSLKPIPDPASALDAKSAAVALRLEEEKYSLAVEKTRRSARAAVTGYINMARKRDIVAKALALAESKLALVALRVSLGQAVRSDSVEAEIARSGSEIDLVDAVVALLSAEREIEKMLDIPPGTLTLFFEARGMAP